jgi:hypothetical protein
MTICPKPEGRGSRSTFMYEISQKGPVILCTIVGGAVALLTIAVTLSCLATANEITPKWEFQSTKDEITDEIYTSMRLSGESGLALLSLRCEKMIDVNRVNVPIYTLQLATSDYLGKTGYGETRSVIYRLGAEHAIYEEWKYSDKNAEQEFPPKSETEVLKRINIVKEIIDGTIIKIRARTYRHEDLDFTFEGRDPTGANEKLLTECVKRTLDKNRK